MLSKSFGAALFLSCGLLLLALAGQTPLASASSASTTACSVAQPVSPALRQEILSAREAVWRAWFANDQARLEDVIPEETLAINAGEEAWQGRTEVLESARGFAASGARLVRLEYPRTEIRLYGDVAILYTTYLFEVESNGQRQISSGRGTEIFVHRGGRWVNPGWHLDSGR